MLSGLQDEVIPSAHMRELWTIAKNRSATQNAKASEIEVGTRFSKYVEFEKGTHSESLLSILRW
jgi:hypothetical protein